MNNKLAFVRVTYQRTSRYHEGGQYTSHEIVHIATNGIEPAMQIVTERNIGDPKFLIIKAELEMSDRVKAALAELGNTADEIAESLRAQCILGDRGNECGCPLSVYLGECCILPEGGLWYVDNISVESYWADYVDTRIQEKANLTQFQRDFVERFDAGKYPFLEQ